jgi:hypothetical protein
MIILTLFLSMLRGAIILLLGLPNSPQIFFMFTLLSLGLVIVKSNLFSRIENPKELSVYLKLFLLNLFFGVLWFIADISYGSYSESIKIFLFFFILPIGVLSFTTVDKEKLHKAILFFSTFVAISCIIEFVILNIFPGGIIGIEIIRIPLKMVSPDSIAAEFAHIGDMYRAHGITGHYHDSGNILAMTSVYLVGTYFFANKRPILFFVALINIIGLLTTLSTANIIIGFLGMFLISFFKLKGINSRIITTSFVFFVIFITFITFFNPEEYRDLYLQFDLQGEKMIAMRNTGSSDSITKFISMLLGHESNSGISDLTQWSEAGIVNILMNLGLFVFLVFIATVTYPLYLYFSATKDNKNKMWIPFITICTGLLTLLHYGSLFRSTSIFLFFAFSSMIFKIYLSNDYSNLKVQMQK